LTCFRITQEEQKQRELHAFHFPDSEFGLHTAKFHFGLKNILVSGNVLPFIKACFASVIGKIGSPYFLANKYFFCIKDAET